MTLTGVFLLEVIVLSFISDCSGQNFGMVPITQSFNEDLQGKQDTSVKKEFNSIYNVAKNISHSKGTIIKSKDGEYEYRRSFTSKVELQVNSLQLQSIISEIKEKIPQMYGNKSIILKNLDILETLVHQYDIGKQFVHLGGFELILSITDVKDEQLSKSAFIVLSAAMQGNLDVQKYASSTTLLKQIIKTLHLPNGVNVALFTLSAFIRNCPASLNAFITENGVYILSNLLNNSNVAAKIHLRVIDILGDVAAELLGENDYDQDILPQVKRTFQADVLTYSVCDKIVNSLFTSKEYTAHEKITTSLHRMFNICKSTFKQSHLSDILEALMEQYDISKPITTWYPPLIDLELRYNFFQELKQLHKKLLTSEKTKSDSKNSGIKNRNSFKIEL